jgi:hypothetical protein
VSGEPWLSVGNNSGTYGTTRAVIGFPAVTDIPTDAQVTDAQVTLWGISMAGDSGATWRLHGLTRGFDETQATWNRASSTAAWTTPGGDFSSTVESSVTGISNDPKRHNFGASELVRQWVADPAANKGVLLKLADETTPASRAIFLSSEAPEPELRPQLRVTYLAPTPESTYYVPYTPGVLEADTIAGIDATFVNTTDVTLDDADWRLSYQWTRPDGTPVTAPQINNVLPQDVAPGEAVTLADDAATSEVDESAQVATPAATENGGNGRAGYVLSWDLSPPSV